MSERDLTASWPGWVVAKLGEAIICSRSPMYKVAQIGGGQCNVLLSLYIAVADLSPLIFSSKI